MGLVGFLKAGSFLSTTTWEITVATLAFLPFLAKALLMAWVSQYPIWPWLMATAVSKGIAGALSVEACSS